MSGVKISGSSLCYYFCTEKVNGGGRKLVLICHFVLVHGKNTGDGGEVYMGLGSMRRFTVPTYGEPSSKRRDARTRSKSRTLLSSAALFRPSSTGMSRRRYSSGWGFSSLQSFPCTIDYDLTFPVYTRGTSKDHDGSSICF